jgi:hypothetical protein
MTTRQMIDSVLMTLVSLPALIGLILISTKEPIFGIIIFWFILMMILINKLISKYLDEGK